MDHADRSAGLHLRPTFSSIFDHLSYMGELGLSGGANQGLFKLLQLDASNSSGRNDDANDDRGHGRQSEYQVDSSTDNSPTSSNHAGSHMGEITTGGNAAGNGGDGLFVGAMTDIDVALFSPINIAVGAATATQSNTVSFDQGATQRGGIGGHGGSGNEASGGYVLISAESDQGGPSQHAEILSTGGNAAGDGGSGAFIGAMNDTDVAIYSPLNIALGAYGGTTTATQYNTASFNQGATQLAGIGGQGGTGNVASSGGVQFSHLSATNGDLGLGLLHSSSVWTGNNASGNGGDGTFVGAMIDHDIAIYAPINIAIGLSGAATATQYNTVYFNQSAMQIAGVGGAGGVLNSAMGGSFVAGGDSAEHGEVDLSSLAHHGTAMTGHNTAGNGGDGMSFGNLSDTDIAIFAPINIASTAPLSSFSEGQPDFTHIVHSAVHMALADSHSDHHDQSVASDVMMLVDDFLHLT
ncbi:hypothetical protein [Microvirga puerhi]|uniref:PE-PGRS family protein n=1 Tax=Microvirga puerhi TaxID=2876078 RepID=A0ABS7VRC2_9HYPH|nr:hypothetical protein [Microvirga puerhi]MBZ6078103.1 hypothetical protein [Microvirga puerhi]